MARTYRAGTLAAPPGFMNNVCETCGNTYDKPIEVTIGGTAHVFDSFQCAIQALAPRCAHCQVPLIGQGVEARGQYFCCAHCAREAGIADVMDRAAEQGSAAT